MREPLISSASLVGRILLSTIFVVSGTTKVLTWSETAAAMTAQDMPLVPLLLTMTILIEIGAGLCVLLGYLTRLGALALAVFLVPVTLVFHDFWSYEGPAQLNHWHHFSKNAAIIGGLVALAAAGPGRCSLDYVVRRRRRANAPARAKKVAPRTTPALIYESIQAHLNPGSAGKADEPADAKISKDNSSADDSSADDSSARDDRSTRFLPCQ